MVLERTPQQRLGRGIRSEVHQRSSLRTEGLTEELSLVAPRQPSFAKTHRALGQTRRLPERVRIDRVARGRNELSSE
jgi:hypothetical protein